MQSNNEANDLDGLRLIALGRIPRCSDCELYHELLALHTDPSRRPASMPQQPTGCVHKVCAPLALRLSVAGEQPAQVLKAV